MEKLIDFLEILDGGNKQIGLFQLRPDVQNMIFDELKKLPQFRETKNFEVLNSPIYQDGDVHREVLSLKLMNDEKFNDYTNDIVLDLKYKNDKGEMVEMVPEFVKRPYTILKDTVKIYSINLTPTIYDEPNGVDVLVSPTLFNPKKLTPKKTITFNFCVEGIQDDLIKSSTDDFRKEQHGKLDQALDMLLSGKHNYTTKKGIMVRIGSDSFTTKENK